MKSARSYVESEASGVRINMKFLKAGLDTAVKENVDSNMSGTLLLTIPSAETNKAMARYECDCYVRGKETCSGTCLCRSAMKVCEVTCNCHGYCCNSLATMSRLDVRDGALGQELYTREDLPQQKIAFVVCGKILTEALFHSIAMLAPLRSFYGVRVAWPGHTKNVPGDPGEVKFVVDPSTHVSGMANHSCDPNTAVSPCWSNGKVYAVGKTLRRIIAKEALTFDYKWTGVSDGPAAELCFCRTSACRGFIADPASKFMERAIHHYEKELVRLKNFHDDDEQSLLDRIDTLDSDGKKVLTVTQQLTLIRRLDKNDKLQVAVDNMEAAIRRAKGAMAVARHAKCVQKLQSLDCIPLKPIPRIPNSPTSGNPKLSCCGWFANENDEPIRPLPLSLALACCGVVKYVPLNKKPWVPSGSRSRSSFNGKHFPPRSLPCSHNPTPRTVRPRRPKLRPLGNLPDEISCWPEPGFTSLDERRKIVAWSEGRISARDRSRSVYPPDNALRLAYWLHTRVRKPDEKKMRTFRAHWSGLSTQDLMDRYAEESAGESVSRRVVHCVLADLLTYTPYAFRWTKSELKLVEDREGDQWPLLWSDLLSLPGPVPEFSADRAACATHMQRCKS